ncbi:hypothetical protein [Antribacter gilvus]|uniref:hypothetical protein n=1 Tax=Antribacter gilvus TaxID=2304675 RepID=UPI000F7992AC|nr:hypothetical protein [Antribacter gilvus]
MGNTSWFEDSAAATSARRVDVEVVPTPRWTPLLVATGSVLGLLVAFAVVVAQVLEDLTVALG